MKKTSFAIVAALFAFALPALAADITLSSPISGITLEVPGKTTFRTWSEEEARVEVNRRLLNNISDSDGWQGIGKARLKIVCPTGQSFTGIPVGGLDWVRISNPTGPDRNYTGAIEKISCN